MFRRGVAMEWLGELGVKWRGGWDLNPRGGVTPYGISSAAH